ncbi:hypothetical protein QCA50_012379 [Cerrena zonata]|uniref:Uncharacterized protein n=1 Tax=Cerrena zonata TaxID=2478898 RepID=A0AAW0G4D9_9APHY
MMLEQYIRNVEPDAIIQCTNTWPNEETGRALSIYDRLTSSLEQRLFEPPQSMPPGSETTTSRSTWVLMDEIQKLYWDIHFWTYLKNPIESVYYVLFAAFGSEATPWSQEQSLGTPLFIDVQCRVGLHPSAIVKYCLCFDDEEFDEFIFIASAFLDSLK